MTMTKDLTKPNNRKGLAGNKVLWLLNLDNGRVFPWTALLAVRKGFIDCTEDGQPINPKDVPGDHPWIRQQTVGLRERMRFAGANTDTLQDFGRQLTEEGTAKFRTLAYERAKAMLPKPGQPESSQLSPVTRAAQVGATIRVMNKLEASVQRAKDEINEMAVQAIVSHGFTRWEAYRRIGL